MKTDPATAEVIDLLDQQLAKHPAPANAAELRELRAELASGRAWIDDAAGKPNATQEVIHAIELELARPIERPQNGFDLLILRDRLKSAKELGALRDELKSGQAEIVDDAAKPAKPASPGASLFGVSGGRKHD
jgi:hypothetical protein